MKFIILCCVLLSVAVSAQDYCSVCIDHTMCRFGDETGRSCGKGSEGGVTNSEIQRIVQLHNEYRSKVALGRETQGTPGPQPTAANMQRLVWDHKLAQVAQRWADQCTFKHDKCRDDPRFNVGQNIYYSSGLQLKNWTRAIESWYQEVNYMNGEQVTNYDYHHETSHYVQLTWAKTRYIGCARRSYSGQYRPRASPPLEYILGEARTTKDNQTQFLGPDIQKTDPIQPNNFTTYHYVPTHASNGIQHQLGFFGGATFDPNGAQGAITKPTSGKKSAASPALPIVHPIWVKPTFPFNRPQFSIPTITYPAYKPRNPTYTQYANYEAVIERQAKEAVKGTSAESSDEDSSEDSSENKQNIVVPSSLQLKSWTKNGWGMIDYDLSTDQVYICNYGPTGNFIHEPIYIIGPPCSKCPSGTQCRNGLCD